MLEVDRTCFTLPRLLVAHLVPCIAFARMVEVILFSLLEPSTSLGLESP